MFQEITIVGNLGRDPELRYTPQGVAVCDFSVATNERWTDQDGKQQDRTTWFRVTTWRRMAETCARYLTKGRQVLVKGRMTPDPETGNPRTWTGKDGIGRTSYEVTATTVKFLGGAREEKATGVEEEEEEIPF